MMRRPVEQERFVVGCALTRTALAGYLGRPLVAVRLSRRCPRCSRPHGKPHLAADLRPQIHWSTSYAGDLLLVAFALDTPLGVDVEELAPVFPVDGIARLALTMHERSALCQFGATERTQGLLRYWVRKEAIAKATGEGLRLPFSKLTVSGPDELPRLLCWPDQQPLERVALYDLKVGVAHLASLAVLSGPRLPIMLDGSALLRR
jgi:4'-phosphopantetheinyl transferase